ncbi:hypothetical protein ACOME3_006817 [Neoechinorhynchus agilis]
MRKRERAYFCREHPDSELIEDYKAGDLICCCCGAVVGERVVDVAAEWRTFQDDPNTFDRCRTGDALDEKYPLSLNMATVVGSSSHMSPGAERIFKRYRESKRQEPSVRTLLTRRKEVQNLAALLKIPNSIIEKAEYLIKHVGENKGLNGRGQNTLICSCIYIACRQAGEARTLKEICAVAKASKRDVGRCYKQIMASMKQTLTLVNYEEYLPRYCSLLNLSLEIRLLAIHFSKRSVQLNIVGGRSPQTVAAACIYLATRVYDQRIPVAQICDVVLVSPSTVCLTFKSLVNHIQHLFPPGKTFPIMWEDLYRILLKELTEKNSLT